VDGHGSKQTTQRIVQGHSKRGRTDAAVASRGGAWTSHNREDPVLLRPARCGLLLHTLFYADEVRALDETRCRVYRVVK